MFEREFGSQTPEGEEGRNAEILALNAGHVDLAQARLDYWRWGGLFFYPLLGQLGKGYFVWLDALIVASELVVVFVTRSLPLALLCLATLAALEIYKSRRLDQWVAEHNARVDARIRDAIERTSIDGR
jgi:hypothetical protein